MTTLFNSNINYAATYDLLFHWQYFSLSGYFTKAVINLFSFISFISFILNKHTFLVGRQIFLINSSDFLQNDYTLCTVQNLTREQHDVWARKALLLRDESGKVFAS